MSVSGKSVSESISIISGDRAGGRGGGPARGSGVSHSVRSLVSYKMFREWNFNIFSPQIELRNSIVYVYVVLSPRTESKGIIEDNDNNQFILNDF